MSVEVYDLGLGLRVRRQDGTTYVDRLVHGSWIPLWSVTGEVVTAQHLQQLFAHPWQYRRPMIQHGRPWASHLTPEQRRKYVR